MNDNGSFFVSVDNRSAPQYAHAHLDDAMREAERLAALPENRDAIVRVLRQVDCLQPVTSHAWASGARAIGTNAEAAP